MLPMLLRELSAVTKAYAHLPRFKQLSDEGAKVAVLAGWSATPTMPLYNDLNDTLVAVGCQPVFPKISWRQYTFGNMLETHRIILEQMREERVVACVGHSYGGLQGMFLSAELAIPVVAIGTPVKKSKVLTERIQRVIGAQKRAVGKAVIAAAPRLLVISGLRDEIAPPSCCCVEGAPMVLAQDGHVGLVRNEMALVAMVSFLLNPAVFLDHTRKAEAA